MYVSADETVCSDVISCLQKHASNQYGSANKFFLWRIMSQRSPALKKFQTAACNVEVMFRVFWDVKGVVHPEFIPTGTTINYCVAL